MEGGIEMARISGYDSNSISVLFSSLGKNRSTGSVGGADILGINYSDYNTIKSGSYFKLMKAYYGNGLAEEASSLVSTSKDSAETIASIESNSDDLVDIAKEMYPSNGKLFKADKNGEYDMDEIASKVKSFAESYNHLIDSLGDSKSDRLASAGANLINYTNMNATALSKIGITIDSKDYSLKVDEEKLKSSKPSTVKSLFNGSGSFAYSVATKASMIKQNAEAEANKSNTYGKNGKYAKAYQSGSIYKGRV